MKNQIQTFCVATTFIVTLFALIGCGSDVPQIEAAEKDNVEKFLEEETETTGKTTDAEDSLLKARKLNLAESANASPHKSKSCDEILIWLEERVQTYASTGDTIALNSFISIENDVIFNSCLNSDNKQFREKYNKILQILE